MTQLVLSLFPGIGLLDRAFEEEGFTVVRGPDVLWGGDIRNFHPPAGKFDGVIGGPPCQVFSVLQRINRARGIETKATNLIPEFERCVADAEPEWFVMENVIDAPAAEVGGYRVHRQIVEDWKTGGKTKRRRAICFGSRDRMRFVVDQSCWPSEEPVRAVTRNARVLDERHFERAKGRGGVMPGDGRMMAIEDVCELQGLPRDFFDGLAFSREAVRLMLGNGVPLPMGRAIARAVKKAIGMRQESAP